MEKINLLDCTLRDGGYINDWNFGKESISSVVENMLSTGIEVVEIGFLKNEPYDADRCVFNSMEQIKEIRASHEKSNALYSVMAEVVNPIPLDQIAEHDENSADIIRVVIWKTKRVNGEFIDALDEGYEYCQGIVNKGYRLCVQPARVDQYTDDEFRSMVRKFSQLNPLAIYVVDSWGTQNPEELLHYMHIADEAMPKDIMLGYHGHNNMMQALSVSQAMIKENFARNIIIDASVYGIGRGAGNLNIEIIAKYMNEHCGKCYNILPMLDVYENCVKEIYKKEAWGYSVPYYLTAKYNCNPAYARLFKHMSVDSFESALKRLSNEQRVIFNAENFDFVAKKRLAIIIPTANRYKAIENWLHVGAKKFEDIGVDIIVFDSSSDEKTNIVVSNYIFDGLKNLQYVRWQGKWDGFSLDNKVIDAYEMFCDKYEYIWIHRDGLIINSKAVEHEIFPAMNRQNDFIVVNTSCRDYKKIGSKKYTDVQTLFREQLMQMTILGATITKGELVKKIIRTVPNENGKTYGLWQPMSLFHYIAGKKIAVESIVDEIWIYNACAAKSSFWGKNTLLQWCDMWCDMIDNLPDIYHAYKDRAKFIYMTDFHPFYVSNLLLVRSNGGMNIDEVEKCKDKIKYVCNTNPKLFYIISVMPKFLAAFIANSKDRGLGKIIAALYYICFGIVPGEKEIME